MIIASQSLHGKYPDLADDIVRSAEVDLIASKNRDRTEWLNEIGVNSPFCRWRLFHRFLRATLDAYLESIHASPPLSESAN